MRGERDVIALIFVQYFFPKLEAHIFRSNFLLVQGFSTRDLAGEALQEVLEQVMLPLWKHLSGVQKFNNTRNAEAVSIGISKEIDGIIWSGSVIADNSAVYDLEKLSDALDDYLIEVGQNAIKAARSRAIDMSVDAVSQLFVSAGEVIAKRRAALRNPYGRINELWPHNSQKKSETNSAQRSISDSKLSTSTVDRENSASDSNTRLRIWCPQCSAAYEVPESAMRDHTSVQCSTCKFVWTPSIQRANDSILEGSYYSASKIVTCSRCYQAHSISPKERIATCSRCGAQLDSKNSQS
jgi:predicted Zn finger-like uncharacterized protein